MCHYVFVQTHRMNEWHQHELWTVGDSDVSQMYQSVGSADHGGDYACVGQGACRKCICVLLNLAVKK